MLKLEYGYYDVASNENEVKNILSQIATYQIDNVSVFPYYVKLAKTVLQNRCSVACVIDYPFGLSDTDARILSVNNAILNGANVIQILAPSSMLCNKKYDKFKKEIELLNKICIENSVELRYILEYKIFTSDLLYKLSYILSEQGINIIYPSSNHLMNNISDNILVTMLLKKKNPKINIVVNGSVWTEDQIDLILNNKNIYAYKTSNIYTLEKIYRKTQDLG
jgi:deoxyribose-phosphate aldolase